MINTAVLNYHRFIDLRSQPLPITEFLRIYYYYIDDHPEVFWINPRVEHFYFDNAQELCLGVIIQYISTDSSDRFNAETTEIEQTVPDDELTAMRVDFNTKINQILQRISAQDDALTRELKIYNYIADNVKYDDALAKEISSEDKVSRPIMQSAYGAAIEQSTVCSGFSKLFLLLANSTGLECLVQYGKLNGEGHQWNIIRIDGGYYNIDVTEPIITFEDKTFIDYTFFNVTDQQIMKTHIISPQHLIESNIQVSYNVPVCDASENSFENLFALKVSGNSFNQTDYQQKIARLNKYNISELYFSFPEGSSQTTAKNYFNANYDQMETLASNYYKLERCFYYFDQTNSAFIKLNKK